MTKQPCQAYGRKGAWVNDEWNSRSCFLGQSSHSKYSYPAYAAKICTANRLSTQIGIMSRTYSRHSLRPTTQAHPCGWRSAQCYSSRVHRAANTVNPPNARHWSRLASIALDQPVDDRFEAVRKTLNCALATLTETRRSKRFRRRSCRVRSLKFLRRVISLDFS